MQSRMLLSAPDRTSENVLRTALDGLGVAVETPPCAFNLQQLEDRNEDFVALPLEDIIEAGRQGFTYRAGPLKPWLLGLALKSEPELYAHAVSLGCFTIINCTLRPELLRRVFEGIREQREQQLKGLGALRLGDQPSLDDFVSHSPVMHAFMQVVHRIKNSESTLLLIGETGVGKERLARAIHNAGPRRDRPFVAVNCGALTESLLESELFGHEKGAFTGANRDRRGCFEAAHGGTLFLDEIGEMPAHLQIKLLRVLQEREVQRVGGEHTFSVDVRLLAATNRDLKQEVEEQRFRADLYFRLSVVTLLIPPLRERREDIPELVENYIGYFATKIGRSVEGVDSKALALLCTYAWPGNVRELMNVIERAVLLTPHDILTVSDLPEDLHGALQIDPDQEIALPGLHLEHAELTTLFERPWREVRELYLRPLEKEYIAFLLRKHKGSIKNAAAQAGIVPRSLNEKMRQYGLKRKDYLE